MTSLNHYMQDGACRQARAVLAMLQGMTIEKSWDAARLQYQAEMQVARWENCREQGYVVTLRVKGEQLNIAFFEHRNSDGICAIRWVQNTLNSPTIATAEYGGQCYADKWNVSKSVPFGEIVDMSDWIQGEFINFWEKQMDQ